MNIDFTESFKKYEQLVNNVDSVCGKIKDDFSECVTCKIGCSDCCYALFDLTLIEAMYINKKFNERFQGPELDTLLEKANRADRDIYKIKRKAFRLSEKGETSEKIINNIAKERIACPLLNENQQCDLYEFRPITCRMYGFPTEIGGKGYTCGKSGFSTGSQYPTIHFDRIHQQLINLSKDFALQIQSRFHKLYEILVPLSMALITQYDKEYLGIGETEKGESDEKSNKR